MPRSSPRANTFNRWTPLGAAAICALALFGCSSDDDASTGTASSGTGAVATTTVMTGPGTTSDAVTTSPGTTDAVTTVEAPASSEPETSAAATTEPEPDTTAPVTTDAASDGWERIVPGGDCECADGSEFSFWVRNTGSDRVVFYFQGGGACFSAETCSFTDGAYKVTTDLTDDPSTRAGIFDFADARNPFAGDSFVFVPYCTGDVHIGDAVTEYAPELTVHHKGFVNGSAALQYLTATFPNTSEVVVTGESAGSVPSPLFAGLVSDQLPDASIVVLGDGSGAYPDVPGVNASIGALWGTARSIPDWPENAGLTVETWSFPGLYVQSGKHDPDIVFARHDYAYDSIQSFFAGLAGMPAADLVALIDQNETQIEAAGVNLLSYISPGSDHTVLSRPTFYTEVTNGVALVDWVTSLVDGAGANGANGEQVSDVHCVDCGGPDG